MISINRPTSITCNKLLRPTVMMIEAIHDHWLLVLNLIARFYLIEDYLPLRDEYLLLLLISRLKVSLLLLFLHLNYFVFQNFIGWYMIVVIKQGLMIGRSQSGIGATKTVLRVGHTLINLIYGKLLLALIGIEGC